MACYLQPLILSDALSALAGVPSLSVLAGGTDFYPARVGRVIDEDILDISRIVTMRGISHTGDALRIGATTTWADVIAAGLPAAFDGLTLAAREVGGQQIQNAGTIAGNLCNASPAADGTPALLALGAAVELVSSRGTRQMPLEAFVLGSRKTVRASDELVTAIVIPAWPQGARGVFVKLGARRYLVISIVMVSVVVALDARGAIARCGIAVGACSAVAQRLVALEKRLVGTMPAAVDVRPDDLATLAPISDVRGSGAYRLDAALALVSQSIAQACAA